MCDNSSRTGETQHVESYIWSFLFALHFLNENCALHFVNDATQLWCIFAIGWYALRSFLVQNQTSQNRTSLCANNASWTTHSECPLLFGHMCSTLWLFFLTSERHNGSLLCFFLNTEERHLLHGDPAGGPHRATARPRTSGMCLGSDRPDDQTAHLRAELHKGLIWFQSVSSVRQLVASGRHEMMRKEETESKEHSKKTWPMMKWLWDTHKQIVKPLSQTCDRIWRAQACAARKSARVCVRWGVVCTPTAAFMAVAAVWTGNCQREEKSEKCARLQLESGFRWTWQQLKPSRSDVSVQVSLYHFVRDSGFVVVIADLSILCLATLESAILAIDGPLKFRVLIIWSIQNFTDVFNHLKLVCPFFRTVSWSYQANTVWSWTESCNFDLYNPSKITSEGMSLTGNRDWSHRTSKSWTSSFCKRILEKSESPCTASEAPIARKFS